MNFPDNPLFSSATHHTFPHAPKRHSSGISASHTTSQYAWPYRLTFNVQSCRIRALTERDRSDCLDLLASKFTQFTSEHVLLCRRTPARYAALPACVYGTSTLWCVGTYRKRHITTPSLKHCRPVVLESKSHALDETWTVEWGHHSFGFTWIEIFFLQRYAPT